MSPLTSSRLHAAGLLLLRVWLAGALALGHGASKLAHFAEKSATFSDPLGIGSRQSLALAIFGEFFCPIFVALGLFTRLAVLPPLTTMLVAAVLVHAADPWAKKEFALLYAVPFITLLLTGPGEWSLDTLIRRRRDAAR